MNYKIFFYLILIICISSCSQKENVVQETTTTKAVSEDIKGLSGYQKMKEIEKKISTFKRIESLRWEKQTPNKSSAFIEVEAYLDTNGKPRKIIEYFRDGEYQPEGKITYYIDNDKLIFALEQKDVWKDSLTTQYIEKRIIYNQQKPKLSQIRKVDGFSDINTVKWQKDSSFHPSLDKVNNILSGKYHFDLHFISFIQSKELFLLLGENKPNTESRYITAVRIDKKTPFITNLLANAKAFKFRPVNIKFKVIGGNGRPTFRVLTAIHWDK